MANQGGGDIVTPNRLIAIAIGMGIVIGLYLANIIFEVLS